MSVSTKELFTAFFKGLAFAKGLNFGDKNKGMAEDRWITIHPGGDLDVNRRIEIDDEGYILKGFGNKDGHLQIRHGRDRIHLMVYGRPKRLWKN